MKTNRILAGALAALTILLPLTSCGKAKKNVSEEEKPQILEHIFRGEIYPLPEMYSLMEDAPFTWDAESGQLTCAAAAYSFDEGDDGYGTRYATVTLDQNGIVNEVPLDAPDDGYVSKVLAGEDATVFLWQRYDEGSGESSSYLSRVDRASGERIDSPELSTFFGNAERGWFFVNTLVQGADGELYLNSEQEIVVLNRDFVFQFSVTLPGWVNAMAASPDGTVWVVGYFGSDGMEIAPIDRAAKKLGKSNGLPDGVNEIYFGAGHDFYYTDEEGVWAADLGENGKYGTAPVMSYLNSNASRDGMRLCAVVDEETLLFAERTNEETWTRSPSVWRHAEDVDLSAVTVIEVAYADFLRYQVPERIVAFNRAHPDIRIVTTDYSRYATEEDYQAGMKKLATELATGVYRPDLVLGSPDSLPLTTVLSKKLYLDLTPYVEKDEKFNKENIFGSVLSAFTAKDGSLWALTDEITLETLLSTPENLGKYADRDGWTLGEMMDYAMSLPAGVELMDGLTQDSASYLLAGGYGAFIDEEEAVCHFEGPDFLKFLAYLKTLPKSWEEYQAKAASQQVDYDERYHLYHEGKIALKGVDFYDMAEFLNLEMAYGTKDYVMIGFPRSSEDVSGAKFSSGTAAAITKYAKNLDAAWAALKAIIDPDDDQYRNDIPILRSSFDVMCEEYYSYRFEFYYDGSASWGTYDPDSPDDQRTTEDLDRPGIVTFFTKEDAERIKAFLDQPVTPVGGAVNEEVSAIIGEEVSAYLGGSVDAEGCAKRIQSRVSIWLAEHK
ncbi:MAG: hypothetical protein II889_03655 [Clostridia bacterium]|nr:hypothetical protein [Clostridia bacterium]